MLKLIDKLRSIFFAKSYWLSEYKEYQPNLVFDTIHQILIDCRPEGNILNIGAGAFEHDFLNMPYFRENKDLVSLFGINIDPMQIGKFGNFEVLQLSANKTTFNDEFFDCIICNAMMEHDPRFWLTLEEIRRVMKKNGLLIVGVPAFIDEPFVNFIPMLPKFTQRGSYQYDFSQATLTYTVHCAPGDYYRFSQQACLEVIFDGYDQVNLRTVMRPPRIIGYGRKTG